MIKCISREKGFKDLQITSPCIFIHTTIQYRPYNI